MPADDRPDLLKRIPSMTALLKHERVAGWQLRHGAETVAKCVREAVAELREAVLAQAAGGSRPSSGGEGRGDQADSRGSCNAPSPAPEWEHRVLAHAEKLLDAATGFRLRAAINATGIILHTGLGRAVFPERVMDSVAAELKGYTTLAVDRETGERAERDELIEPLLTELTGAGAATVVNNNAAATLLSLAALAAGREVIVSRGQLIEIGGSFRLPEVMAQSGARLVEVGSTNRTHLKDYRRAITPQTAAILRVHPSNYRIVGFTSQPELPELAALAREHNLLLIDDLGAGALLDLAAFGLPHEPTVRESIAAGADLVLFSGDKLIGASQAGILVGRRPLIQRLRQHPLMRAVRVDKTCLMVLERTLQLFRQPDRLRAEHPLYRMLTVSPETLRRRASELTAGLAQGAPVIEAIIEESAAYLGSGSLPTEALPSVVVTVAVQGLSAAEFARRLRRDEACVFGRIEHDRVRLDMRTISDAEVPLIIAALVRAIAPRPA